MKQQLKDLKIPLLLGSCLLPAACTGRTSRASGSEEVKPAITATIEPQRYFTEAIAGDKFAVVSMVPKGSSPETYNPISQQLVPPGDSKAYLRISYTDFEQTWMNRLMNNAPHIQVFDTSEGIGLILNNGEHNHAVGYHDHDGHNHAVEPYIWNFTVNALILVGNTPKALCMFDKPNETYYLVRYDSLCQRTQHTDSLIRRQFSAPEPAKAFMIYHPALFYFARDYGLHQISIKEGGKEPSPVHLRELIDLCKSEKVSIISVQPELDKCNAETIAQQIDTKVAPTNPLSYDWETEMLNIVKTLTPMGSEQQRISIALMTE